MSPYSLPTLANLESTWVALPASPWVQALEAPVTSQDPSKGSAPAGGLFSSPLFPLVMVGVIFWFVVIGPERKARRAREALLGALKKGDRVLTNGGLYGSVAAIQDQVVTLTVSDGVRMRFARSAIQTVISEEAAKETKSEAAAS